MSKTIAPAAISVAALWEEYRALVVAVADNRGLRTDMEHQQKIVRAWKRWADAYLAEDAA